ncbi:DUF2723 domain-containing protein [Halosquirtibacter xylanolyticus]|uniref:glycosyltransferase family 117 protein n=1 Tax=Halosquirtibacter xylanolyticus TaxID=3374599 RepID=UPI003747D15C|nr:DUF2723 domain-containing protein [Prolixibacteraceae bacterium]
MKQYKFYNKIIGWIVFAIAATVYLMTIEPTASFWDCGEFITTSYRLEVGHPPGAPFFLLLGRFFSIFASDPSKVAMMINGLSALASAFTILFLFWSITHLAKNIVSGKENPSLGDMISIFGAGAVGALAYTFSDTFWFSAVEGEVYATSSLFTAIVFWAILKWENEADQPHANRWLVFIAYMIGLSIGVHLLNLLAIPAIGLVYYFKKYKPSWKGAAIALGVSVVILGTIMWGIIPGVIKFASWVELFTVNSLGMPYNTGVILYSILLISGLVYGIYYTTKKDMPWRNLVVVSTTVIIIGYFSYATIVIRSSANPPMDQNNPNNVFSLLDYLNREQYGDRPLFYGAYYNTPLDENKPYDEAKPSYVQEGGKYKKVKVRQSPNYQSIASTFFPRMYSSQPTHVKEYKKWANIKGHAVTVDGDRGQKKRIMKPTFGENLTFFFKYQVNYMYLRYFMWNFSGRQNDIQGHGDVVRGNWISGIPFIDNVRLGDQSELPSIWKENRGHNTYYMLPLILGLLGMFFQYHRSEKGKYDFAIVMMLFIMTGLAIVVYLNQTPLQPRERDYAYAGSFYAFTIWIGLGVLGLIDLLKRVAPYTTSSIIATLASLVLVPGIMASENWDDHDRSNRYTCRSTGYNYLNTCAENGIIFTNGDNDTFPLWYSQDVEGIRTDMRVCNLSYLQTDWYIDQMKRKAWNSAPLPITFEKDQYVLGTNDYCYVYEHPSFKDKRLELRDVIDGFIKSDNKATKLQDNISFFPTRMLKVTIDKEQVIKSGLVARKDSDQIVSQIDINLKGNIITKDQLMLLDMIAHTDWTRPFYFAITVGSDKYLGLQPYFRTEGFAYRLVPLKNSNLTDDAEEVTMVDTDKMYYNMMEKFTWGNMNDPKVYLDENNARMAMNIRNSFVRLAEALLQDSTKFDSQLNIGKEHTVLDHRLKAIKVLNRCEEVIPSDKVAYDYFGLLIAQTYFKADDKEAGVKIFKEMLNNYTEQLNYYTQLPQAESMVLQNDIRRALYILKEMSDTCKKYDLAQLQKSIDTVFEGTIQKL